jgi:hypothetical protein
VVSGWVVPAGRTGMPLLSDGSNIREVMRTLGWVPCSGLSPTAFEAVSFQRCSARVCPPRAWFASLIMRAIITVPPSLLLQAITDSQSAPRSTARLLP